MTWQTKTVLRILMLVALILTDDVELKRELKTLATHIQAAGVS